MNLFWMVFPFYPEFLHLVIYQRLSLNSIKLIFISIRRKLICTGLSVAHEIWLLIKPKCLSLTKFLLLHIVVKAQLLRLNLFKLLFIVKISWALRKFHPFKRGMLLGIRRLLLYKVLDVRFFKRAWVICVFLTQS